MVPRMRRFFPLAIVFAIAFTLAGSTGASPGANGRIAFTSDRDGNGEIYAMQPDGSGAVNLTNDPSSDQTPAWSPDARDIAFATFRDGRQAIYRMHADGSAQTRLSPEDYGSTDDMQPSWSPDGHSIAFASTRPFNDMWSIWAIDTDGSNLRRLTTTFSTHPAWSPDGTRIAYVGTDSAISIMNADGTGQQRLTASTLPEDAPAWSPEGTQIVFGRYRGDWQQTNVHQLFVVDVATGAERQLTSGDFYDGSPSWSPDGSQIVFQRHAGVFGTPQLFLVAPAGGTPAVLTAGAANYTPAWAIAVAPPPPPPGDTTPPTISIASPAEGATYLRGATEAIWFRCRDDRDGPNAIARCYGSVDGAPAGSGSLLPTGSPGSHTLTVTAVDAAGNTATASRTYTVIFDFRGFDAPLKPYPELTSFKAGDRVPLRFSLAGYAAGDVVAAAFSTTQACTAPGEADGGEAVAGALAYNGTHDRYTFTWQTDKRWAGTCRQVALQLTDGTTHRANMRFTK
jgi:Tol biopolymer transport system component